MRAAVDPEWRAVPARMGDLFDGVDPVAFGIALSLLPEDDPYLVATRIAIEVGDGRRARHRALREVSWAIHGGRVGYWARRAYDPSFEELQRLRGIEIREDGRPRGVRRPGDTRTDHEGVVA